MDEPPNPVLNNLEEHPLLNQVILKVIFNFLVSSAALDDWKNIRLVCKTWHSESLCRWRSNFVLVLLEETTFFEPWFNTQRLTASYLLIHWLDPNNPYKLREMPYLNYKLHDLTINLPFCETSSIVSLFWSTVGPWMKNLILRNVRFESKGEKTTERLLQFLIEKTPNLQHVTFHSLDWDGIRMPVDVNRLKCTSVVSLTCKNSYRYPLKCFPKLQKVQLECGGQIGELMAHLLFPDFTSILDHNPVESSKLTHLDMMDCFAVYKPDRRFHTIQFPSLEYLSIKLNCACLHDDQRDNEFGRVMMANHRETLKVLKTFCWLPPRFGNWAIDSCMPVLSELFIWGNCMDNLDFLRFTPNLSLLHVDLYGFEKQQEMKELVKTGFVQILTQRAYIPMEDKVEASRLSGNLAGVVLQKLEKLQINVKLTNASVQVLGEWMPNLKIFKTVLVGSSLRTVCKVWPKLEQLNCLYGSEITDEDVIGNVNGGSKMGIADLKQLKSFHYNSECDTSTLSDQIVHNGFLKMKELTDLQICVSENLSQESEDTLISRICNVKIIRNYSGNDSHKNWKCCLYRNYLKYISNYERLESNGVYFLSDSDSDD